MKNQKTDQTSPRTLLKNCALFRDLPPSSLTKLAWLAHSRTYSRDTVVFNQGDPGDALYVVASGRIRVSARSQAGREVFFNQLGPNDAFGEIALIDGNTRTAKAVAMEETVLLEIPRSHFMQLLEKDPTVSIHLLKLFCKRIRWTSELVEEAAVFDVPARMARRLIHLLPDDDTEQLTSIEVTQEELARFLGVGKPVVQQCLQDWRRAGWVDLQRGQITIVQIEALRQVSKESGQKATLKPTTTA